jgi:universal stress protein A
MIKLNKILLAVELVATERELIDKAMDLAKKFKAQIFLVHAIEHISAYGSAYGIAVSSEIEDTLFKSATKQMHKLGKKYGIPEKNQVIKFGSAKVAILEEAENKKVDLIMLGSHGRHGINLLLGSTANAVIHAAKCDVFAVRIKK